MKKLSFYLLFTLSLFACMEQQKKGAEVKEEMIPGSPDEAQAATDSSLLSRSPVADHSLARHLMQEWSLPDNSPPQFLTAFPYLIDYIVVVNKEIPKEPLQGESLIFSEDLKYQWFSKNSLSEQGAFRFDPDRNRLLLVPDEESNFPTEWNVKMAGDVVVLAGTSTFGNNHTQMHMIRQVE